MRKLAAFLVIVSAQFLASGAWALEWVFCDSCATADAFASAAIAKVGTRTGEFELWVGNRVSGRVHQVVIAASRSGNVPTGAEAGAASRGDPLRNPAQAGAVGETQAGQIFEVLINERQSPGTEAHFLRIIHALQGGTVTVEDHGEPILLPDQRGFGSFSGRDQSALRDYIWSSRNEAPDGARSASIPSEEPLASLYPAVDSHEGSITQCYIFRNGDLACFKAPSDPEGTADYVGGSAVDRNGKAIPGSGEGGRSRDGGFQVVPAGDGSRYGPIGYSSHGALWKSCMRQREKVTRCSIVLVKT